MVDRKREPHGPEQLPDRQPVQEPSEGGVGAVYRPGATSRWVAPAGVLAGVVILLCALAFQLQIVVPIIGIVWAIVMWLVIFSVSRRGGADKATNRRLAVLMIAFAAGSFLVFVTLYLVETLGSTSG